MHMVGLELAGFNFIPRDIYANAYCNTELILVLVGIV